MRNKHGHRHRKGKGKGKQKEEKELKKRKGGEEEEEEPQTWERGERNQISAPETNGSEEDGEDSDEERGSPKRQRLISPDSEESLHSFPLGPVASSQESSPIPHGHYLGRGSSRPTARRAAYMLEDDESLFVAILCDPKEKDRSENDGETVSPVGEADPELQDIVKGDIVVDETAVAWTPDGKRKVLSTAASFKAICVEKGYSFETLSKAKYSTMMIVYHICHPDAPWVLPMCGKCQHEMGYRFNAVGSSGTVEALSSGGNMYLCTECARKHCMGRSLEVYRYETHYAKRKDEEEEGEEVVNAGIASRSAPSFASSDY